MRTEIERKFLLRDDAWRQDIVSQEHIRDGLIVSDGGSKVRVRLSDRAASITVKGPRLGLRRDEYEYPIPPEDARRLIEGCGARVVEKTRYKVRHDGLVWDVDIYHAGLAGLSFAEVELESEDQPVSLPAWVGQEITGNARFGKRHILQLSIALGRAPTLADILES